MNARMRFAASAAISVWLMGACANIPVPAGIASVPGVGPDKPVMTVAGELPPVPSHTWPDLNEDLNDHRADGWGLVFMPEMEKYLNGLLRKIKVATGTADWPGAVHITAQTSLNASSSAAGNIYISLGWLQSAESEDEIFAILSHEFGHIYLNHYAVYDVKNAGDTSTLIAGVTWTYVNRKVADKGWNGLDKIAVVQAIGTMALMPAWQRHIEEQADLFGATVSLRCGYSYIHGFKAFLERIDSYDRDARARNAKLREEQDNAIREKIRTDTLARAPKTPPPPAVASDAAVPLQALAAINDALTKVNGALTEGQISLNQGTFSAAQALDDAIAKGTAAIQDPHPDGAAREDDLSKEVATLIAGKRPPGRVKPWEDAKHQRRNAQTLAHYALVPDIEMLEAQHRYAEALKLAAKAASGANADDAMLDFYLGNAIALSQGRSKESPVQAFSRNLKSPERSWRLQVAIANNMASTNRQQARSFIEQQFVYFGRAPKAWPDLIAFYRDSGDVKGAKDMAMTCSVTLPDYRQACLSASQTPAELAEAKAKADAHAKIVVDNVSKRWFKQ